MALKYIVVEVPGGEAPVVFSRDFFHAYVASRFEPAKVVSAGFVRISDGKPECYGGSSSLKISSRGERDTALVTRHLLDGSVGDESRD